MNELHQSQKLLGMDTTVFHLTKYGKLLKISTLLTFVLVKMFSKEQTTIDPMIPDSIKPIIIQSKHHHNRATSLIL